jgi:hypothetical protein
LKRSRSRIAAPELTWVPFTSQRSLVGYFLPSSSLQVSSLVPRESMPWGSVHRHSLSITRRAYTNGVGFGSANATDNTDVMKRIIDNGFILALEGFDFDSVVTLKYLSSYIQVSGERKNSCHCSGNWAPFVSGVVSDYRDS